MKETAATNGPEGTVSKSTGIAGTPIEQGMRRLQDNVKNINEDYLGDIDLRQERIKGTEKASSIHTLFHR